MSLVNKDVFIGYIYSIDYNTVKAFILEGYKDKNGAISENSLLLVKNTLQQEYILVRVRRQAYDMPKAKESIAKLADSFLEGEDDKKDIELRKLLDVSGYECDILGTISKDAEDKYIFWSDIDNFYWPHNYKVYKPNQESIDLIIKLSGNLEEKDNLEEYGKVRFSSSNYKKDTAASFYINPLDILARRVALFWMTRTGKSNSLKNLIGVVNKMKENKDKIKVNGHPIKTIGQIIFDVNGEYGNTNVQDGTSIYDKFKPGVQRYSFIKRDWFEPMKINFFDVHNGWLEAWFELMRTFFKESSKGAEYFQNFLSVEWGKPEKGDYSGNTRYKRRVALYKCILHKARFDMGVEATGESIEFEIDKELSEILKVSPARKRWTVQEAIDIFMTIWRIYEETEYFEEYKNNHWKNEWIDPEMKALFPMLTRNKNYGPEGSLNSYIKLNELLDYHSPEVDELFTEKIMDDLERGYIIIVDLSSGPDDIKRLYSEKLAHYIFDNNKNSFINWEVPTHIQMYFEEAHNLFPRGESDLTQIYNRLAKEGAKYHIGLVYATQEPSSISPNILKNTENWFISHLNNDSEIQTLCAYNDFEVYKTQLKKFSYNDVGYSRIKMYSYPFTFPIQINKFQ